MKYSNAGHCYPLIGKNFAYDFLKNSEAFISEYTKDCSYNIFEYQLEPFDKLLLYTDGIYEWKDNNKFFGFKSFKEYFIYNDLNKPTLDALVEKSYRHDDNHDDVSYILMKINKVMEKSLLSTLNNLDAAQDFLYYEVKKLVADRSKFSKIVQASSEMIINAFEHGNKYDESKYAHVSLRYNENALEINICDEGDGFNWRDKLNMQCVSPDSVRGRGIYITNHYSKRMLYNEKGNEVTLKFII
jgi:anti-sigma regulatory factor (Ser/Thr protein kinase)